MTLVELKQQITDKQCDGTFMIFVCPKLPIIAEQYIDAIAEVRHLDKLFVESIFDTQTSAFSLVMDFEEIATSDNKTKIHFYVYKYDGELKGELTESEEIDNFLWYESSLGEEILSNTLKHEVVPYCLEKKLIR